MHDTHDVLLGRYTSYNLEQAHALFRNRDKDSYHSFHSQFSRCVGSSIATAATAMKCFQ